MSITRNKEIVRNTIFKMFIAFFGLFLMITFFHPHDAYAAQKKAVFNGHTVSKGEYVIKNSDTKVIKAATLKKLSSDQLRIARNEIYARHGRKFQDEALQNYFNERSWYHGTIEPDSFDESVLNKIENKNIALICKAEAEKKKPSGNTVSEAKDGFYTSVLNYKSNNDVSDCGSIDHWALNDTTFTLEGSCIYLDPADQSERSYTSFIPRTTMNLVISEDARYYIKSTGNKKNYVSSDQFWDMMNTTYKDGGDSCYLDWEVQDGIIVEMGIF